MAILWMMDIIQVQGTDNYRRQLEDRGIPPQSGMIFSLLLLSCSRCIQEGTGCRR